MDKRQNMLINVIITINGDVQNINKKMNSSSEEYQEVKQMIRKAKSSVEYVNEYINNNGIDIKLAGSHLCGTCGNMLKCPKVMDSNKLRLDKYPFIKCGVEVIEYDVKKVKEYNNLVKKYKDMDIIYDELDENLKEILRNSGRNVELLNVYGCNMYYDDSITIDKFKKK